MTQILNLAVGILYFLQIFFINALEPSSFEANLFGPNTLILFFSNSMQSSNFPNEMNRALQNSEVDLIEYFFGLKDPKKTDYYKKTVRRNSILNDF